MSDRFFSSSPLRGPRATLAGDEAHHMRHVMRLGIGDQVVLFDGSGQDFDARIISLGKHEIELELETPRVVKREIRGKLLVAAPLPKGDRQRFLIEKLVEVGATSFVPLVTERGIAQPTQAALQRLQRVVIEASKQCGRSRLMSIEPGIQATQYFESTATDTKIIAQVDGRPVGDLKWTDSVTIAVGPEGGFTVDELRAASTAGWQTASLGTRVLRTETAAVVLAGIAVTRSELC